MHSLQSRIGQSRFSLFSLLISLAVAAPAAHADEIYTFVVKKQEEKVKTRWSLQDWLDTKEKMRMQDLWLAMHSPSPYEFFIGGDYQIASNSAASRYNAWEVFGAAYATIFGLEFHREAFLANGGDVTRMTGAFDLRVFGFNVQATNLTLQLGMRQQDEGAATIRNPFASGLITVYLGRYFGINGMYRHYFPSTPNATGTKVTGARWEAGAFLDFKFLRVFGSYFSEPESREASTGTLELTRSGVLAGTSIFF